MQIIEQYRISKTGNEYDCEDVIFVNPYFACVIDGATSRNGVTYCGKKSGLMAADITKNVLTTLKGTASLRETLDFITDGFLAFYREYDLKPDDHNQIITASAIIYSKYHNQIWLIGDCQCRVNGVVYNNPNGIDQFVASVRSFVNQGEILKGRTDDWIQQNDPGSEYIKMLLTDQFLFQNKPPMRTGSFSYTAFDGRFIKEEQVKVIRLGEDIKEVVLASDGYPNVFGTLEESEEYLANILIKDPLCIYEHKCVKGIKKGFISYDDRAYLRLSLKNDKK